MSSLLKLYVEVVLYSCYCCNENKDVAKPSTSPCAECLWLGLEQPCYNQQVSDEILIERLRQARDDMLIVYGLGLNS